MEVSHIGQVRHGSATTTHAVSDPLPGRALQRNVPKGASFARATEPGAGHQSKTVAKSRKRATVEDMKTGPQGPRSTVLTEDEYEEAAVVAFRRHTLLPLDDCRYALRPSIPHLTRSYPPSNHMDSRFESSAVRVLQQSPRPSRVRAGRPEKSQG